MKKKFKDKYNREIEIELEEDFSAIVASHNEVVIGSFDFEELDDEFGTREYEYELINMEISSNYQRAGIGLEMLKLAVEQIGVFKLPRPYIGDQKFFDMANPLTDDGAELIKKAIKKGVLGNNFISQYNDEDEEE